VNLSRFDGIRVLDGDGCEVILGDVLRNRPSVLVYVRHFG